MDRVGAIRRVLPAVTSTLAAVATALLAISCGAPFTVDLLAHAEDTTPPVVVLSSPDNQSYYAKTVTVTGQATDCATS